MTVYLQDPDVTLYHGDALETLRGLPDESVHCVVTSPPYWGLRDYGTGSWAGGDPDCDHLGEPFRTSAHINANWDGGNDIKNATKRQPFRDVCGKCGAHRTDNQMGLEPTPELYVQNMVQVFREVRRVLRRDGTCWLNMGDCYNSRLDGSHGGWNGSTPEPQTVDHRGPTNKWQGTIKGLGQKQLLGMPWRLAFALQQDGWWLRADIIWAKPNPMPESVTDRPTKAHEYVFLLTRSPKYFFDQEAVREQQTGGAGMRGGNARYELTPAQKARAANFGSNKQTGLVTNYPPEFGRNVRSVWEIATEPFPAAHFATFPTELARRCILAGTSERGCCPGCGAPWVREVERGDLVAGPSARNHKRAYTWTRPDARSRDQLDPQDASTARALGGHIPGHSREATTLGWRPTCGCWKTPIMRAPIPCTVLDPFAGACTVPHVARRHGRHSIGIELSETYLREIALPRLQQLSLLA